MELYLARRRQGTGKARELGPVNEGTRAEGALRRLEHSADMAGA